MNFFNSYGLHKNVILADRINRIFFTEKVLFLLIRGALQYPLAKTTVNSNMLTLFFMVLRNVAKD